MVVEGVQQGPALSATRAEWIRTLRRTALPIPADRTLFASMQGESQ